MASKEKQLVETIKQWIRAEYMARLGPRDPGVDYWNIKLDKEDELRELVTGERGYLEAARKLGVDQTDREKKRVAEGRLF